MTRIAPAVLLVLAAGSPPHSAYADPVRITSGALVADRSEFRMNATGERGLAVEAAGSTQENTTFDPLFACDSCLPGQRISLGVFAIVDHGTVSVDGATFNLGLNADDAGALELRFSSSVVLPEFTGDPSIELSAPFVLDEPRGR